MNQALAVVRPQSTKAARPHLAVLPSFDLSRPVNRVRKEHPDWSPDRLREAEEGYRAFLARAKVTSGPISPTPDVDEVWHAHILFTKQYVADCVAFFGHYFHHEPFDETNRPLQQKCDGALKAADCQGGGDGCTACGSGCSGGGTITRENAADRQERIHYMTTGAEVSGIISADCSKRCCGTGCANKCGGCCESGGCSGGGCKGQVTQTAKAAMCDGNCGGNGGCVGGIP